MKVSDFMLLVFGLVWIVFVAWVLFGCSQSLI